MIGLDTDISKVRNVTACPTPICDASMAILHPLSLGMELHTVCVCSSQHCYMVLR